MTAVAFFMKHYQRAMANRKRQADYFQELDDAKQLIPTFDVKAELEPSTTLKAVHEYNLMLGDNQLNQQVDGSVVLPVEPEVVKQAALAKPVQVPGVAPGVTRFAIHKDCNTSIYLNFAVTSTASKTVTLASLGTHTAPRDPEYIKGVKVLAFTPSYIDLKVPFDVFSGKYAVIADYQSNSLPELREFVNTAQLLIKSHLDMTPLVRTFVHYDHQVGYIPAPAPLRNVSIDGLRNSFHFFQGPPGVGKTSLLINHAKMYYGRGVNVHVLCPTNEVVLEISMRLSVKGIKHNLSLSDKGMAVKLDVAHAVNIDSWDLSSKVNHEFKNVLGDWSNITVSTINKFLTSRLAKSSYYAPVLLIDEFTLMSTGVYYAVLNKNPEVVRAYGDECQGCPYIFEQHPNLPLLNHPVAVFGIKVTSSHEVIRYATRMPGAYNDLFLAFFYGYNDSKRLIDFDRCELADSTRFVTPNLRVEHEVDHQTNSLYSNSTRPILMTTLTLVATPYIASQDRLKEVYPINRVLTLRPVQGQSSNEIYLDLVRSDCSRFFTNQRMIVAFSRFTEKQLISHLPLPPVWAKRIMEFVVDLSQPVSVVVKNFEDRVYQLFKQKKNKHDSDVYYDSNGMGQLRWYLFLNILAFYQSLKTPESGVYPFMPIADPYRASLVKPSSSVVSSTVFVPPIVDVSVLEHDDGIDGQLPVLVPPSTPVEAFEAEDHSGDDSGVLTKTSEPSPYSSYGYEQMMADLTDKLASGEDLEIDVDSFDLETHHYLPNQRFEGEKEFDNV